jgi:chromosome segregation ATPase
MTKEWIGAEIEELLAEKRDLHLLLSSLKSESVEMTSSMGVLNSEIFDLRTELSEFVSNHVTLQKEKVYYVNESNRLCQENADLRNSNEHLKKSLEQKDTELSLLQKAYNDSKKESNNESHHPSEISQEPNKQDIPLPLSEEEKMHMVSDIAELENYIFDLETKKEQLQKDNDEFQFRIKELERTFSKQRQELLDSVRNQRLECEDKSTTADDLEKKLKIALLEKESLEKRLKVDEEVEAAIRRAKSELESERCRNQALQDQLNSLRDEQEIRQHSQTSIDYERLHELEYENAEMKSQISVLKGEQLLTSIQQRDAEIISLRSQIDRVNSVLDEVIPQRDALVKELDELRSEFDNVKNVCNSFVRRNSEQERLISSTKVERNEFDKMRRQYEHMVKEYEILEEIRAQKQVLEATIESQAEQIESLFQHIANLNKSIADLEAKSAQDDIAILRDRAQLGRVLDERHKLRSEVQTLQSQKEGLMQEIADIHQKYRREWEALGSRVEASGLSALQVQSIEIVASLHREISELQKKYAAASAAMNNELSERIETQKRLREQQSYNMEHAEKFEQLRSDHSALVNNLTELFNCVPAIPSIIAAASVAARNSNEMRNMQRALQAREVELARAKVVPVRLQACLQIEQKRSRLYETRLKNVSPGVAQSGVMSECVSTLLNCVISGSQDSMIQSMSSSLLERMNSGDWNDTHTWRSFVEALVSYAKVGFRAVDCLETILRRVDGVEEKIGIVMQKMRIRRVRRGDARISAASKQGSLSLYERSVKKTPLGTRIPLSTNNNGPDHISQRTIVDVPRRVTPYGVTAPPFNSFC